MSWNLGSRNAFSHKGYTLYRQKTENELHAAGEKELVAVLTTKERNPLQIDLFIPPTRNSA